MAKKNCIRNLKDLLGRHTELPKLIVKLAPSPGQSVTHVIPPSNVFRCIHERNREKFGRIFGADKQKLTAFWRNLFASTPGANFKQLHPNIKDKTPEQLNTAIPIIIHEDAAPFGKNKVVASCSGARY